MPPTTRPAKNIGATSAGGGSEPEGGREQGIERLGVFGSRPQGAKSPPAKKQIRFEDFAKRKSQTATPGDQSSSLPNLPRKMKQGRH